MDTASGTSEHRRPQWDGSSSQDSVVDSATLPALKLCLLGQFQLPHYLYTWILRVQINKSCWQQQPTHVETVAMAAQREVVAARQQLTT
uniref:Uncharacterized protein n=1 Tax=Triticum urartu TaxID=4572 RepID=A0A8R7V3L2_TRIUA